MSFIVSLYRRFAHLIHELAKFGVIGAIGAVIDLGGAAYLHLSLGVGPLTAKTISTVLAATFTYAGNRYWTFRHRENSGLAREYSLFFVLNAIGLLMALMVIGFTHYTLKLDGPIAYNVAQVVGTGLGTVFRFWSYRRWVFRPVRRSLVAPESANVPADRTPAMSAVAQVPVAGARAARRGEASHHGEADPGTRVPQPYGRIGTINGTPLIPLPETLERAANGHRFEA